MRREGSVDGACGRGGGVEGGGEDTGVACADGARHDTVAGGEDVCGEAGVRAPAHRNANADVVFLRQGEGGGGHRRAAGGAELHFPAGETATETACVLSWVVIIR